jgi:hypothetical protein
MVMSKEYPTWKPGYRKLSDDDVRAIRTDFRIYQTIADEYGVSVSVVCTIKNRTTHRGVPDA